MLFLRLEMLSSSKRTSDYLQCSGDPAASTTGPACKGQSPAAHVGDRLKVRRSRSAARPTSAGFADLRFRYPWNEGT